MTSVLSKLSVCMLLGTQTRVCLAGALAKEMAEYPTLHHT